ncbi:MAG: hypothetical protein IJX02_01665 [Clostridia bacterium]|nr:hypothetical protein [Clostridia bacterium]
MKRKKTFIWLNENIYPEHQRDRFCMAEFKREINSPAPVEIEICALSRYLLFVNGDYIGRGPASVGGDFLNGKHQSPYFDRYILNYTGKIEIKALVTSVPTALTEYDFGASGLWVNVRSLSKLICETDESWQARLLPERKEVLYTDYREEPCIFKNARVIEKTFDIAPSPIENLIEEKILPTNDDKLRVEGGKSGTLCLFFDKVYSAYPHFTLKCNGKCTVKMTSTENGVGGRFEETVVSNRDVCHFSPRMRSVGQIEIELTNEGNSPAELSGVYIDYVHYPVYEEGGFTCSDELINRIYDVCMHTLKICRQTIHLDSPTHQEHLACTGDYFIQSLIEYTAFNDPTLSEWDIRRTSNQLIIQEGRLFHTTYSLIYPWWVYEHYMHTGCREVINKKAIKLLLDRFDTYIAEDNGLIEYAPDYMFVDWVVASCERDEFLDGGNMMSHGKMEGYSLHHPPKALGQSVLCMFYYNALLNIAKIYNVENDIKSAEECLKKAEKIKNSINKYLFDCDRGLYVGGLNTPNRVPSNDWLPENTETVYYLKQANVLAVLFGIAPKEMREDILRYVVRDLNKFEMQPYFYHFLLNALYNEGLFKEYGLDLIRRYESLLKQCDKGLAEAWENMNCDYSHAWGATPAYTLKRALSGIEILEPAYKKIRLSPQLFDLDSARYEIMTPYGKIEICQKKQGGVCINAPKEIEIVS